MLTSTNNSLKIECCVSVPYRCEVTYARAQKALVVDYSLRGELIEIEVIQFSSTPSAQLLKDTVAWVRAKSLGVAMAHTLL